MAVSGGIDFDNKGWEEDIHTQLVHTNEAAPVLTLMLAETGKRIAEGGDVQAVLDEDLFTVEGDDGQACAEDWGK
jgi:hypothetical protein